MKVIIAAAGTAGHINPGIAIANKIKKEIPNSKIIFIGTIRGLENDLVPRAGYELKTIEAYGIQKRINITNIKNFLKTIKGFSEAKEIIKEEKPDLVIGTGGYICGAVLTAAAKQNIPTMLHESNAYPGLAVRMLAKRTTTIMVGFKEAKEKLQLVDLSDIDTFRPEVKAAIHKIMDYVEQSILEENTVDEEKPKKAVRKKKSANVVETEKDTVPTLND